MIVYSVTINVEDDIHDDWVKWMKEVHIPDVLATGIFKQHRLLKVISHQEEKDGTTYNIQYDCDSMAELHKYQVQHAPKLQKEHTQRYENKFVAFRTLLEKA
ncbi:MAG: DUF4286 family protein [Vicingaceae bacterium]